MDLMGLLPKNCRASGLDRGSAIMAANITGGTSRPRNFCTMPGSIRIQSTLTKSMIRLAIGGIFDNIGRALRSYQAVAAPSTSNV